MCAHTTPYGQPKSLLSSRIPFELRSRRCRSLLWQFCQPRSSCTDHGRAGSRTGFRHRHRQLAGRRHAQCRKSAGAPRCPYHCRTRAHSGKRSHHTARSAAPGARRAGSGQQWHGRQRYFAEPERARPDSAPLAALLCAAGRHPRLLCTLRSAAAIAGPRGAGQPGIHRRGARSRLCTLRPAERGRHHQLHDPRHSQDLCRRSLHRHGNLRPQRQHQDQPQPVCGWHQRGRSGPGPAVFGHAWQGLAQQQRQNRCRRFAAQGQLPAHEQEQPVRIAAPFRGQGPDARRPDHQAIRSRPVPEHAQLRPVHGPAYRRLAQVQLQGWPRQLRSAELLRGFLSRQLYRA